jgi:hypothetical protein
VKRLVAWLLYLSYKVQTHFFLRVSLRDWLWAVTFVPLAAAVIRRLTWLQAVPLSLLGVLLLLGIEWARRKEYLVFEPTSIGQHEAAQPPIEIDEQLPCRAFGLFAVANKRRTMVNECAQVSYVRTREHIVMVLLKRTRFLLLARSLAAEEGWWYVFIQPEQVQRLETGDILCGIRSRPGVAIHYRSAEKPGQTNTLYLVFSKVSDLQRLLNDLRRDVCAEAFVQAAHVDG